jgi:chromosome segregation ATPase
MPKFKMLLLVIAELGLGYWLLTHPGPPNWWTMWPSLHALKTVTVLQFVTMLPALYPHQLALVGILLVILWQLKLVWSKSSQVEKLKRSHKGLEEELDERGQNFKALKAGTQGLGLSLDNLSNSSRDHYRLGREIKDLDKRVQARQKDSDLKAADLRKGFEDMLARLAVLREDVAVVANVEEDLQAAVEEAGELKGRIEGALEDLSSAEELQEKLIAATDFVAKTKADIGIITGSRARFEALKSELESLQTALESLSDGDDSLENLIGEVEGLKESIEETVNNLDDYEGDSLKDKLEEIKGEQEDAMERLTGIRDALNALIEAFKPAPQA